MMRMQLHLYNFLMLQLHHQGISWHSFKSAFTNVYFVKIQIKIALKNFHEMF